MNQVINLSLEYADESVFYGGNSVHGELVIEARSPIKPRGVLIECFGEVRVQKNTWLTCLLPLYDTSLLFESQINSTGQVSRDNSTSQIPFSFPLPAGTPQSLECELRGTVRYWCQASLIFGPGRRNRLVVSRPFSVLEVLDLNAFPDSGSVEVSAGKRVACRGVCGAGQVRAKLEITQAAVVPGQNIVASFTVENNADVRINMVHLTLTQMIGKPSNSYLAPRSANTLTSRLCHPCQLVGRLLRGHAGTAVSRADFAGVGAGETLHMPRTRLHVPALPCSTRLGVGQVRSGLQVDYAVVLLAHFGPSLASDLVLSAPVLIGSVPRAEDDASAFSGTSLAPSYVESPGGPVTLHLEADGDGCPVAAPPCQFTPRYVYYPTIALPSNTPNLRRSILKKKRQEGTDGRPSSELTDSTSFTGSYLSQSTFSIRFETPV